jgi:hypothetical protein
MAPLWRLGEKTKSQWKIAVVFEFYALHIWRTVLSALVLLLSQALTAQPTAIVCICWL